MIRKRQFATALLAPCLIVVWCVRLGGQAKSADERDREASECGKPRGKPNESPVICNSDLKTLAPSGWGRLGRGFQYEYQLGEQFRSVLAGSGSTAQILPNPEHYLNQHSLKFQFSELFRSPAELTSMVKQIAEERAKEKGQQFSLERCRSKDVVACLAGGEGLENERCPVFR